MHKRSAAAAYVGAIVIAGILLCSGGGLGCAKKADEAANKPPPGAGKGSGAGTGSPGAAGQQSGQLQVPTGTPP